MNGVSRRPAPKQERRQNTAVFLGRAEKPLVGMGRSNPRERLDEPARSGQVVKMIGSTPSSQASGTLDTIAVASTNSSSSLSRAIPSIPFRGLVPMRVTEPRHIIWKKSKRSCSSSSAFLRRSLSSVSSSSSSLSVASSRNERVALVDAESARLVSARVG